MSKYIFHISTKMARFSELTRFTLFVLVLSSVSSSSIPNDAGVDNDENFVVPIDTDAETGNAPPAVLPSVTDSEIDPNCDCQDEEALCHKFVRKLIDTNVLKGKEEFLREFRIKKICGSDGKSYSTMCQFQCARMNLGDPAGLHRVNRANCRKPGQGRPTKDKENTERKGKYPKMQDRLQNDPAQHPLVCICPRNYYPICASNGVTYGNKCAFDCARENIDHTLTIVTPGEPCNKEDKTVL